MAELDSENPEETVAVGDLFKLGGSKGGRRTWNLRRFYLRGASLIYYSLEGQKKGSWDVRNCIVRFTTPDECNMPDAIFSFAVVGPNKFFVMCASNERSRTIWMKTLADQIQEFKRDVRIFLRRGEVVIADARVKKKGGLFGSYSVIRLIITNFPKILVVDPVTCALREQRSWKKEESPRFAVISEHRFKVTVQGKELDFEDVDKGSTYWQTIFKRFQDVQIDLFVKKENKPIQVDAPAPESERKTSTAPPITPMQIDDIQTSANMEMGDIELSSSNLKVLQGAIENVKELATAISARIIAIDEEIDWEMEARDPVLAASAAAFREQRKQELQVLNDNVVVMSANLENLVTMTLNNDPSAKNVDITAVEKVYEETSAMILMLSYDEDRKMPADEMLSQEDLAVEENIRASVVSRSVRVDSAPDVVITEENFDANDLRCRPPHWNDIRVKRVVIKEIADRLLGLTEEEIVDRRAERISQEESEMISEVVIHGRLLNSDCIRAVHRSDCDAVFAPSVDTLSQQRSVLEASVLITPDNFQADSADVRPSGWNALRARRAYLKEAAQRALGVTSEDLNHTYNLRVAEEERLMIEEVERTGKVNVDTVFDDYSSQVVAESAPSDPWLNESDASSAAWQKLRRDRVQLKEWMDRMQGIEEGKILERRAQREVEEEAILRAQAETRDMQQLADHTKGHRESMMMTSFLTAANQTLELLTEGLVDSIALSSEPTEPLSPSSAPLKLADVPKPKVVMKEDLKKLNITSENFDLNDPRKRPTGWQQVKLKRVEQLESEERLLGMSEEKIRTRRRLREIEAERQMVEEVTVSGLIKKFNEKKTKPIFPSTFYASFSTSKTTKK